MSRLTWQNVSAGSGGSGSNVAANELLAQILRQSASSISNSLGSLQDTQQAVLSKKDREDAIRIAESLGQQTYTREAAQRAALAQIEDPEDRARVMEEIGKLNDLIYSPSKDALEAAGKNKNYLAASKIIEQTLNRENMKLGANDLQRLYRSAYDGKFDGYGNPIEYIRDKIIELDGGEDSDRVWDGLGKFQRAYQELRDEYKAAPDEVIATVLWDSLGGTDPWLWGDSQITAGNARASRLLKQFTQEGKLDELEAERQSFVGKQQMLGDYQKRLQELVNIQALATDRGDTATSSRAQKAIDQILQTVRGNVPVGDGDEKLVGGEGGDRIAAGPQPGGSGLPHWNPNNVPTHIRTDDTEQFVPVAGTVADERAALEERIQRARDRKLPEQDIQRLERDLERAQGASEYPVPPVQAPPIQEDVSSAVQNQAVDLLGLVGQSAVPGYTPTPAPVAPPQQGNVSAAMQNRAYQMLGVPGPAAAVVPENPAARILREIFSRN